jgi:DNA-binding NtrC family response regulator
MGSFPMRSRRGGLAVCDVRSSRWQRIFMAEQTIRILVVDDEPGMRKSLADILLDEGYDVTIAEDGTKAVEICAQEKFDVVIMDVLMPGLDGVEAFRRIRTHSSGTRVILMSAFGVEELKYQALDEGAIAFLEKPLDIEAVVHLIENANETSILVVEAEEALKTQLHDSLKHHGYRVTTANSAHDALEVLEQIRFDIILIDVELPVMSGLDLYLAIKQVTPAALAIMISGAENEFLDLAQQAVDQTAYSFVRKPLDLDQLLQLLERIHSQRVSKAIQKPAPPDGDATGQAKGEPAE